MAQIPRTELRVEDKFPNPVNHLCGSDVCSPYGFAVLVVSWRFALEPEVTRLPAIAGSAVHFYISYEGDVSRYDFLYNLRLSRSLNHFR